MIVASGHGVIIFGLPRLQLQPGKASSYTFNTYLDELAKNYRVLLTAKPRVIKVCKIETPVIFNRQSSDLLSLIKMQP